MSALTVSALGVLYQFFDRRRQAVRKPVAASFLPATIFLSVLCFVVAPTADGLGACDTTVFGFKKYEKTSNGGVSFQDTFSVAQPASSHTLIVFNGNQGENRISRGSISINGVEVAAASDFSQQVDSFEKPIGALQAGSMIDVELQRGDVGSFIVVRIVDRGSSATALSGVVLNTQDQPLKGVAMTIGRVSADTDSNGLFFLGNLPCGPQPLHVDASGVKGKKKYASVNVKIPLTEGITNQLERPIFLPEIDLGNAVAVPEQVSSDITISNPDVPGVSLTIKAGTQVTYPDGSTSGQVSITEVPVDKTPRSLPDTLGPSMVISVQPEGVLLSQAAAITYPNTENLPPGSRVELFSLSPPSGGFVSQGAAFVSADGQSIVSDENSGLFTFDWHFWLLDAPFLDGFDEDCDCRRSVGSEAALFSGGLHSRLDLPSHRSLGVSRSVRFNYSSLVANPHPIAVIDSAFAGINARPSLVSYTLAVNGIPQGGELFVDATGLDLTMDEEIRQAMQFDASALATGVHPADFVMTMRFGNVFRAVFPNEGRVIVHNRSDSPFGAGWMLDGLQQAFTQSNGDVLIVEGDGSSSLFEILQAGAVLDLASASGEPLGSVAVSQGAPSGAFGAPQFFEAGPNFGNFPGLRSGDFNNDGIDDLLGLDRGPGPSRIAVLIGNGDGTFEPPRMSGAIHPQAESFRAFLTEDFDGDGITDLAAAPLQTPEVLILLGNGDGTFRPFNRLATTGPVRIMDVGDFNADSLPDLVVSGLSIFFGNGDGTFQPQMSLPSQCGFSVAVGDFNQDGQDDIAATTNTTILPNLGDDEVCILLNDGSGGFPTENRFQAGDFPIDIRVADFNADSFLDVVTANTTSSDFSVLLGNGDGTLQPQIRRVAERPRLLLIADFNGDALPDVGITNTVFQNNRDVLVDVSIKLGNGDGTFNQFARVPLGNDPNAVVVGNFNGDSRESLFVSPAGDFSRLVRNADGSLTRILKGGTRVEFDASGLHTSTVDRNGNQTVYSYNPDGTVSAITDPAGLITAFSYINGKLANVVDPAGRQTFFTIGPGGDLEQVNRPDNTLLGFEYANAGYPHLLTARIDARSNRTDYSYNFAGRFASSAAPSAAGTIARSLSAARMVSLVDPSSGLGTISNPAPLTRQSDVAASFTDGEGNTTQFRFNNLGNTIEITDALAQITAFERDGDGNIVRSAYPNGTAFRFAHDGKGNVLSSTNEGNGASYSFTFDPVLDLATSTQDPNGNTSTIQYDVAGNPTLHTDAGGNQTAFSFDGRGLVTSLTDAASQVTTFQYNLSGNLVSTIGPLGNTDLLAYDSAGNLTSYTDAEGKTSQLAYDAFNRLVSLTDAGGKTIQFDYDGNGNLTGFTDARLSSWSFAYDEQNRLISSTDPPGASQTFVHDLNGNVVSSTNRNGEVVAFSYDSLNRLVAKTLPGGQVANFAYDEVGHLVLAENSDSVLTMTYDAANQISSVTTAGSPHQPEVLIAYGYDLAGNRVSMTDSLTGATAYARDSLNRLETLTSPNGLSFSLAYDALSRVSSMSYPNGVTTTPDYDASGRLIDLTHDLGGAVFSSFSYGYDGVNNRTSLSTARPLAGLNNSLSYQYDASGQLIQATHPIFGQPDETFQYDPSGNRLRRDGESADAVFDSANRLIEDDLFTYAYDGNGNLVLKTAKAGGAQAQFVYDAENRLIQAAAPGLSAVYRYDALGRRILKDVNGQVTRYVYDIEDILLEFDGANALSAQYIHGPGIDTPLGMRRAGEDFFYHADALGSVTELTDDVGSVVQAHVFDSFGNIVQTAGPLGAMANPYGYNARELDLETGLYYYRARQYASDLGRFLNEDPLGLSAGDPNFYRYVGNSPNNFTDPFGLCREANENIADCIFRVADERSFGLFSQLGVTPLLAGAIGGGLLRIPITFNQPGLQGTMSLGKVTGSVLGAIASYLSGGAIAVERAAVVGSRLVIGLSGVSVALGVAELALIAGAAISCSTDCDCERN